MLYCEDVIASEAKQSTCLSGDCFVGFQPPRSDIEQCLRQSILKIWTAAIMCDSEPQSGEEFQAFGAISGQKRDSSLPLVLQNDIAGQLYEFQKLSQTERT